MLFSDNINWQRQFAGNTVEQYAIAIGIFVGLLLILSIFQKYVLWRVKKATEKTTTELDDLALSVVESIRPPFYFVLAAFISINFLSISEFASEAIEVAIIVLLVYQAIKIAQIILGYLFQRFLLKERDADAREAFKSINRLVTGVLWAFGVLLILQNLGVNISSILAGLGIGGVAIALASKEILSDLFSSLAIVLDKPFVPGDFIVVGEHMGVVQKVGIKTTRIKALQGEEIVISNTELTSTRIQNFKKLEERRVVYKVGVEYSTSPEKLKKIAKTIEKVIEKEEKARFDRAHFMEFGDSSLVFEVVYYALTADYNEYMDLHQSVLTGTFEQLNKLKVNIAFPTQTIFLQKG